MNSCLFERNCDTNKAFSLLDEFQSEFEKLKSEADDLKQLQELLDSNVVDFGQLLKCKTNLLYLNHTWSTIKEIRNVHDEWESIRWQKVNIKLVNEETEKQVEMLNHLPADAQSWDVVRGARDDITNLKVIFNLLY